MNLNSAIIQAADTDDGKRGEIYVGKYVDPANQEKATITYQGKGVNYTDEELAEAQQRLQDQLNSGSSMEINDSDDMNYSEDNSQDTIDGEDN